MKTYIINLKSSTDRKEYMEQIMDSISAVFDYTFIEAVNGKDMSDEEVSFEFDQTRAMKMYGRELRRGEIGCTLSHKRCAKMLLDSDEPYALFLEDDLIWREEEKLPSLVDSLDKVLRTEKPTIVLLSGDYWYTRLSPLTGQFKIASVRDAVCTQSYVINRAAAQRLLDLGNWHVADDWWAIKKQGIQLKAIFPHVADQNRADLDTVIAAQYGGLKKENLSISRRVELIWLSFVKKVLVKINHFESKNFKWK